MPIVAGHSEVDPDDRHLLLSIEIGAKGPNLAMVTACTTSTHCIGEAAKSIRWAATSSARWPATTGSRPPACCSATARTNC